MAKLYFRYGTMSSGKTLILLAVAHSYEVQGKRVLLLKPSLDTRFDPTLIRSRSGLEKTAHFLVAADTALKADQLAGIDCILVDEAQFLSPAFVEHLRSISLNLDIPVICYGLRTDFATRLFEGAKRLMELADAIEEIKTTCASCNKKAVFNMRVAHGAPTLEGPVIDLGAEEKYVSMCGACYEKALEPRGRLGRWVGARGEGRGAMTRGQHTSNG